MVHLPRPPHSQQPPAIRQLALGELLFLCVCHISHSSLFPPKIYMGTPHPHLIPQNPQTHASAYCFPVRSTDSLSVRSSWSVSGKADGVSVYAYLNLSCTQPVVTNLCDFLSFFLPCTIKDTLRNASVAVSVHPFLCTFWNTTSKTAGRKRQEILKIHT